jgi:hypothetical protein
MELDKRLLFVFCTFYLISLARSHNTQYKVGSAIKFECKNQKGEWAPPPLCQETNQEFQFVYGKDSVTHCTWLLNERYDFITEMIKNDRRWECRTEVTPGSKQFIPFSFPFWGFVEPSHTHVIHHYNFVFHGDDHGHLLALSAYPAFDQPQYFSRIHPLKLHGFVKWFKGHQFKDFGSSGFFSFSESQNRTIWPYILLYSLTSILIALIGAGLFYKYRLKPRIIKKYLKVD